MKEPIDPSTPIQECLRDCTAAEKAGIASGTPPYDGVRTWGDLEAVRAQEKPIAAKAKSDD